MVGADKKKADNESPLEMKYVQENFIREITNNPREISRETAAEIMKHLDVVSPSHEDREKGDYREEILRELNNVSIEWNEFLKTKDDKSTLASGEALVRLIDSRGSLAALCLDNRSSVDHESLKEVLNDLYQVLSQGGFTDDSHKEFETIKQKLWPQCGGTIERYSDVYVPELDVNAKHMKAELNSSLPRGITKEVEMN